MKLTLTLFAISAFLCGYSHAAQGPLKVFILAGQSNMEGHANADGHMSEAEKREYLKQFEAKLISPAKVALWKRGASNAGYHYLGRARTFALMGKAFAEANLKLLESQHP